MASKFNFFVLFKVLADVHRGRVKFKIDCHFGRAQVSRAALGICPSKIERLLQKSSILKNPFNAE